MTTRNPRILFVEDSDTDFELAHYGIRGLPTPLACDRVESGKALADYLSTPEVAVAMVVLDIRLPDANGILLARQLRQRDGFATVPIVMFSTSANPRDMQRAKAAGADDYRVKPVDAETFVSVVQDMIQKHVPVGTP